MRNSLLYSLFPNSPHHPSRANPLANDMLLQLIVENFKAPRRPCHCPFISGRVSGFSSPVVASYATRPHRALHFANHHRSPPSEIPSAASGLAMIGFNMPQVGQTSLREGSRRGIGLHVCRARGLSLLVQTRTEIACLSPSKSIQQGFRPSPTHQSPATRNSAQEHASPRCLGRSGQWRLAECTGA